MTLSKGNKQKIQIIAALLHEPKILIMDEPLSGLDARTGHIVKDILKIHTENGGAVLLSTHIMDIAEDLCDRIGIINNGKMVAEGTMEELQELTQKAGASSLEDIFLNITEEEAQQKFGFLLEALNYGAPPHGGIALGLDRIAMLKYGIDDIQLFFRNDIRFLRQF